jgi:flagellum-specific peptidoglycan hydrolase FlgJ
VRVPTREFLNGTWVTIEADFAKYDSFEQSITEHARFFLRNRRYAAALKVKDDPDSFACEIHKAGYATGPDYSTQLIKLMKGHDLYRFDR